MILKDNLEYLLNNYQEKLFNSVKENDNKKIVYNILDKELLNDNLIKKVMTNEFIIKIYNQFVNSDFLENEQKRNDFISLFKENISLKQIVSIIAYNYVYKNNWYDGVCDIIIDDEIQRYNEDLDRTDEEEEYDELKKDIESDVKSASNIFKELLMEFVPEMVYTITDGNDLNSLLKYFYDDSLKKEILKLLNKVGAK